MANRAFIKSSLSLTKVRCGVTGARFGHIAYKGVVTFGTSNVEAESIRVILEKIVQESFKLPVKVFSIDPLNDDNIINFRYKFQN